MDTLKLREQAKMIRGRILDASYTCERSVHIGGALSMADMLAVLYFDVMTYDAKNPSAEDRDRFILSKGHAAVGLYSALVVAGVIKEEDFARFQTNESALTTHPVMNLSLGIESSNGSLGHGLSLGVGLALAGRRKSKTYRTFVLLGDGECNEGAVWEAAMSGAAFKLDTLVAIIDVNGFQNDGGAVDNSDAVEKWRSFGWNVHAIDGHDIAELQRALSSKPVPGKPTAVVARTIKGRGVSFMEGKNEWHHNRLTKSHYENAKKEWEAS